MSMSTNTQHICTLGMIAEDVQGITGLKDLAERATVSGQWITWEQIGSRQTMDKAVAALKLAGHPGFFSAAQRKWGIKIPENFSEL